MCFVHTWGPVIITKLPLFSSYHYTVLFAPPPFTRTPKPFNYSVMLFDKLVFCARFSMCTMRHSASEMSSSDLYAVCCHYLYDRWPRVTQLHELFQNVNPSSVSSWQRRTLSHFKSTQCMLKLSKVCEVLVPAHMGFTELPTGRQQCAFV